MMEDAENSSAALFQDVVFTMIPSEDFGPNERNLMQEVIEKDGGRFLPLNSYDQEIQMNDELTHILTTHIDFPQYNLALSNGLHIVKPSWVINSVNKNKIAQPRQHSPDPSQFLHDVIITTAGLPEGDQDAIKAGTLALGGQYSGPLSKLVTHIITIDPNHEYVNVAWAKGLKCKIVLPHWFDDCLRLGRMISERPYTFPDPEILRAEQGKIRVSPSPPQLEGAIVATPTGVPSSNSTATFRGDEPTEIRKNLNAFMCKKVFFSKDLELSSHLLSTLEGLINHGGGTLTDQVNACDIYIGHFRDGSDYVTASRAGKTVANLSWLYHVINRNKYTNPLSKLLHYPLPRSGLPGFENMRISLSNYSGDARIYLENLVRYCGAEFTKTMKQDNTHLIVAHKQSEKCEAAAEWGINVINHLWLEESYAKCCVQTLTNPRYNYFPARTNLGECTGQTALDMRRVENAFFPAPRESPKKARPAIEDAITPAEPVERKRGRPPKSATTPRFRDDEKENESPLFQNHSTGRASKNKALYRLQDQAGDIALFEKEMKRKGGVIHGGRRSSVADAISSPALKVTKKRKSDESFALENDPLSDGETQPHHLVNSKRAKSAAYELPEVKYRMIVSGDDRWKGSLDKESRDRLKLQSVGVQLITEPNNVDILVAPRILRTKKFVAAIAFAPMVVGTEYLDACLKTGVVAANPPRMVDREGEERIGFKLSEAIERARANKGKLLDGWTVFVTREIAGGWENYRQMIEVNGGKGLVYAGRTGVVLPPRKIVSEDGEMFEDEYVYLVSGESDAEMRLWKTFQSLAAKQGLIARVVQTDWLLEAAVVQEVRWKDSFLLSK